VAEERIKEVLLNLPQLQDQQLVLQVDLAAAVAGEKLVVQLVHVHKVIPVEQEILMLVLTAAVAAVEKAQLVKTDQVLKVEMVVQVHLHGQEIVH
tara:strand:- start:612 stop:896 length:285 start_codon:yes stop_codon:yes gene_type:complete